MTDISISTTSGLFFLVEQCLELLGCATARDCSGNSSKSFPRVEGSKSSNDSCHSRVISAVYFRKIQKVNMFADFSQMTRTSNKTIHEMCVFFFAKVRPQRLRISDGPALCLPINLWCCLKASQTMKAISLGDTFSDLTPNVFFFLSFQAHVHPDPPVVAADVCPSTWNGLIVQRKFYRKPWFYHQNSLGGSCNSLKKVPETLDSWDVLGYSSPLRWSKSVKAEAHGLE